MNDWFELCCDARSRLTPLPPNTPASAREIELHSASEAILSCQYTLEHSTGTRQGKGGQRKKVEREKFTGSLSPNQARLGEEGLNLVLRCRSLSPLILVLCIIVCRQQQPSLLKYATGLLVSLQLVLHLFFLLPSG